jgi:mono/diheme cytochrome c family protein
MKTNLAKKFSGAACGLIVAGLAGLMAGCSSTGSLARQQAGLARDQVDAPGLFAENCAGCHGQDGRAKTLHGRLAGAQNFTDAKWHGDTSNDDIIHAIKTGHEKMPAFQDKLSPAEIEALAAYVQTFKPAS